jgi:hypothetical protein
MTDVRTYTAATTLPPWASAITDTIKAGDLNEARRLFRAAAAEAGLDHVIYAVAAACEPGPDEITLGEGPLVFANPFREGFAWRCGRCLRAFRTGGPDPKAGVNYKTLRGSAKGANQHSAEDHAGSVPVNEMTR